MRQPLLFTCNPFIQYSLVAALFLASQVILFLPKTRCCGSKALRADVFSATFPNTCLNSEWTIAFLNVVAD